MLAVYNLDSHSQCCCITGHLSAYTTDIWARISNTGNCVMMKTVHSVGNVVRVWQRLIGVP